MAGKVGYVEKDGQGTWFCDAGGRRIARVMRYKPHWTPAPAVSACGGTFIYPHDF